MKSRIVKGTTPPESASKSRASTPASSSSGSNVIKRDVASAKSDASQIRTAAEEEADSILAKAKAEAAKLRESAERDGYEAGLGRLNDLIAEFERTRDELFEKNREEILKVALLVARKILGQAFEQRPETMADVVSQAIRGAQHEGRLRIRVHPDDLATLKAHQDRVVAEVGSRTELELIEDRSIEGGGCVVESALGIIDARLDTQMKVLERALLSAQQRP